MQARSSRSTIIWFFLSLAFTFSALPGFAERVEDLPKPTNYVSDFAHVLSPETADRLNRLCGQLDHSATDTQIAVVTIKSLDGDEASDFANRLEEKWKVGKKGSDRGILMLFAIQDRKRWIEVGLGLQGILPDAKVGDIGRAMVPDLKQANYDGAITTGVVQIANVVAADAHVSLQDQPDRESVPARRQPVHHTSLFGLIFKIVIVVLILAFFGVRGLFGFGLGMLMGGGGRRGGGGGGDGGGGGFGGFGGGQSDGGGAGGDW